MTFPALVATMVGERLDPAGGVPDDGQERNWDGQTRDEFLEMLQASHDYGNVRMENDVWLVEEDAIGEIGADEAARRRTEMAVFLDQTRAELDERVPFGLRRGPGLVEQPSP